MIRIPRIKLQWGGAKQTPGEWYLGLFGWYTRSGGRSPGLAVSIRGVVAWGLLAATLGYFGLAGVFWWRQERKPYNFVGYTDVLLYPLSPAKRREVVSLQGRALLLEAADDVREQRWSPAFMKLRLGLERHPEDMNSRLTLAQFFLAYRLRTKAQETLLQGIDYGWPGRAYLEKALALVAAGEDYELVVDLCDRALARHDPRVHAAADRQWLHQRRAQALLASGRTDEALAWLAKHESEFAPAAWSELRAQALVQAGRPAEAVELAEAWRRRAGDQAAVLRVLAVAYREAGRLPEMRATLADIRRLFPADPAARAFGVVQQLRAGEAAEAREQLADYIFRFGGDARNFATMAALLAEDGRLDELEILAAAAAERGIRDQAIALARLRIHVGRQDWARAREALRELRAIKAKDGPAQLALLDFTEALVVAAADPAEGAQSTLVDRVRDQQYPLGTYREAILTLRRAGRPATARQLVTFAEGVFPGNKFLVETRVALDAELEEAARARVPEARAAAPVFADSAALLEAVVRVRATEGATAALALVRRVRRDQPAWLDAAQEPVMRTELGLVAEGDDLVALQGALRSYVNGDRPRIAHALDLARSFHEKGRLAEARLVLEAIQRALPGEPVSEQLRARWFPEPRAAAPRVEAEKPAAPATETPAR